MTLAESRATPRAADTGGVWLVAGIVIASLTEAIASTILALGRADILGDTHATPDEFAWLDIGYIALKLIGFAAAPWLLTRVSPKCALLAATAAMGLACAFAAGIVRLEYLVALRAIQGFAGAVLLVSGQAMLFWAYPASRQPLLQALFAMGSVVAPATVAPALAGWVVDNHSWNWIFFGAVPVALAACGLIIVSGNSGFRPPERRPFDGTGLVLLSASLFSATYVLSQGSRWDWFEESRILCLSILAATALLLFLTRQHRCVGGLFDTSLFGVDDFAFAFFVSFVAGAALFGSAFLIPSFAVAVLDFTPTAAGQLLLPSGALFAGALLLAAVLFQVRRVPPIATVPVGILLTMAAMWMLSGSSGESGAADMMPAMLLRGLGLGFLFLSITLIAFSRLPASSMAFGIGLFNIGRQLGGLIGVAGLQTVIDHGTAANRTVFSSALVPGSPNLTGHMSSFTSFLVEQGMQTEDATKAAAGLVARTVSRQASVIAFDTAFILLSLLFVVAAPVLVGIKLLLSRRRAC